MSISVAGIKVDSCYVTEPQKQVRKVIEHANGTVTYVSRGKRPIKGWQNGSRATVNEQKFADDVDREVTCDYDPDYPEHAL